MPYYAKAIIDFRRYKEAMLLTTGRIIVANLIDNPFFTDPSPSLADVETKLNEYNTAMGEAASRDRYKVAVKNRMKTEVQEMLNTLGVFINQKSKGDEVMVNSSGYPANKKREKLNMSAPQNFKLTHGMNRGSIVSQTDAVKGATGYMHQLTPDPVTPDSVWISALSSRCKHTHKDLQPGTKYWAKITIAGRHGQLATTGLQYIWAA